MPGAAEYRRAAQLLRRRGADLVEAASSYRRRRLGEFGDGPVADAHDAAVASIARRFEQAGRELHTLAAVCEHRAVVCDEYARAVTGWSALDEWDRSTATSPRRPAVWVEP